MNLTGRMSSLLDRWDTETDPQKRRELYDYLTLRHDPPLFPRFSSVSSSVAAYHDAAIQRGGAGE